MITKTPIEILAELSGLSVEYLQLPNHQKATNGVIEIDTDKALEVLSKYYTQLEKLQTENDQLKTDNKNYCENFIKIVHNKLF